MKKILLLSVLIAFASCKESKKEEKIAVTKKAKVKLHVFSGGEIMVNNLELFSQDTTYHGQSKKFADAFYVIQHPEGNLIWDAGLPENLVGNESFNSGPFTVSRKDSLVNQLKSIGLKVSDFKYIALSHSHFDHIGHANSFKEAIWLVQENEYNFVTNDSAQIKEPGIYNMIKDLKNTKFLNGDYDVFDDGTVVIKYMPGHTIGHQTLFLNIGLEKPLLLTGDLYHFEENRASKGVPIFNYNVEQTLKSMESFETFAKEKGAEIIIQHSPKDFVKLKKMLIEN